MSNAPLCPISPTWSHFFPTHHTFSFILPQHFSPILVLLDPPSPPNPFPTPAVPFLSSSPRGEGRPQWSEGSRAQPPLGSPRAWVTDWVRMEFSALQAALSMVTSDPCGRRHRRLRGTDLVTRGPPCWLRLDQSSATARPEQRRTERVERRDFGDQAEKSG